MTCKYIVCAPTCGLGNRLYALYSTWRIAKKYQIPMKMWWEPAKDTACQYEDLFETIINKFDSLVVHPCYYLEESCVKTQSSILIKNNHSVQDKEISTNDIIIFGACQPIHINGESWDNAVSSYIVESQEIKIRSEILDSIKNIDVRGAIGVHVGRGHIVHYAINGSAGDLLRCIPLCMYYDILDKQDKDKKIFISCEDQEDEQEMLNRYSDRIIYKPGVKSRSTVDGMVEAMCNIILLSRCSYIIDGLSSFSRVAAYMGNIKIIELQNTEGVLPTRC